MSRPDKGRTFCKLVAVVYLIIVALAPLADVHLEDLFGTAIFADKIESACGSLDFLSLHELLFSHLNKKADQARTTAFGNSSVKTAQTSSRSDDGTPLTHSGNKQTNVLPLSSDVSRAAVRDGQQKCPLGFSALYLGLSPPSA